jgi:hypothetical protein
VLDTGARDGFFSFECERRGVAEVLPIDYVPAEFTGLSRRQTDSRIAAEPGS